MQRLHRLVWLALVLTLPGSAARAQAPEAAAPVPAAPAAPVFAPVEATASAENTREQFERLLREYPPSVRNVLQLDPSLLSSADYLAPYPRLAAFLQQHPEVLRDPSYYLGGRPDYDRPPDPAEMMAAVLAGVGVFVGMMTVLFIMGSLLRQAIEYRRWVRQSRVQAEVHTKILDRLQSNEDLLAYVQTPAGRRFLEFAPAPPEDAGRSAGAPLGRILWSAQAGVVLATLGLGLGVLRRNVPDDVVPAFYVLSVVALALGAGAIVSSVAAYILSSRLGLLPVRKQES